MLRRSAPSAVRNRDAVLRVLSRELPDKAFVVEIGSGTGEHAVHFAGSQPGISWLPTDRAEHLAGINSWVDSLALTNILPPVIFDVNDSSAPVSQCDAIYSSNTAHIMSESEVTRMIAHVGAMLRNGGLFFLYGPFKRKGRFSTTSNEKFDASLRSQKSAMGIRDIEWMDDSLSSVGLRRMKSYAMPSNNLFLIWEKQQ
jgi:cyclopropane fatty-acyl-phospholipid synthase-like methyltransferase